MALTRKVEENTLVLMDGSETILSIQENLEGQTVCFKLSGKLRSDTAHDFMDELFAIVPLGMNLDIDLEEVEYISSTCQQVLLSVQQKIDELGKSALLISKLNDRIREDFDSTGFSQLLDIAD